MRALLAVSSLLILFGNGISSAVASVLPGPVVTVAQLKPLVEQKRVTVLDTRELLQTDQKTPNYAAGHIPGALPFPYSNLRGPKEAPGAVLPIAQLEKLVNQLGLKRSTPVVLAGSGADPTEFGGPARIYWTLKAAGFKEIAVLNGGLGAWMAAKLPLEKDQPKVSPSQEKLQYQAEMVLSTAKVKELHAASAKPVFVDARPEDSHLGQMRHAAAARWGTIPDSKWLDSEEWFVANTGRLLEKDQLLAVAKREGVLGKPTVSFCNAGHWAATSWFILSEVLGQTNAQMYADSVVGWSQAGLPMQNEPSRATALMWQAKGTGIQK